MKATAQVMGTVVSFDVRTPGVDPSALQAAIRALQDAEARFSPFLPASELSRAGRGEVDPARYSQDLREVLAIGDRFQRCTAGVFSVRPRGRLDANGVVKGWAADRAARILAAAGASDFCLNAGGDVIARGAPEPGVPGWNVGVRSPWGASRMIAVLRAQDCAVATSGAYERGAHIVDASTGLPAAGLASATVVAADLTTADVLATTVFAMGPQGPAWAASAYPCSVLAALPDGTMLTAGPLPLAAAEQPPRRRRAG